MSLESDIAAIPKLDDYKGGIASVRTHQNKEIDAINKIIDAANNNPAPIVPMMQTNDTIWLAVDGVATEFGIYLTALPDD